MTLYTLPELLSVIKRLRDFEDTFSFVQTIVSSLPILTDHFSFYSESSVSLFIKIKTVYYIWILSMVVVNCVTIKNIIHGNEPLSYYNTVLNSIMVYSCTSVGPVVW